MSEPAAFFKYNRLFLHKMNLSVNKIFSPRKATIYTALTFALAMLVLIVSCPVKRLILTNFDSTASSSTKSSQTNIYKGANIENSATANCSIVNDKTDVVKSDISQQHKLPVPLYLSNINNQTGFDINYFLSAINFSGISSVSAQHATLPLFLQHLRLLI